MNDLVIGGWSGIYTADENTMTISDGTINGHVIGGRVDEQFIGGGKVKADYSGNVNTLNVNYDSSSNYIAAHLGLGKISKISANNQLDCYVKYFYSRQSGDNGNSTPSPSVKGGSGMFELGWQVKPDASPLTLDLGLTAWAGKQRGLTGQLGMNWKF